MVGPIASDISLADAIPILQEADCAISANGVAKESARFGLGVRHIEGRRSLCWVAHAVDAAHSEPLRASLGSVMPGLPLCFEDPTWVSASLGVCRRAWHRLTCSPNWSVHAGDQIGPINQDRFGSIGCAVVRDRRLLLLTCAHVVAPNGVNPAVNDRAKRRMRADLQHDLGGVIDALPIVVGRDDNVADAAVVSPGRHQGCKFVPGISDQLHGVLTDREITLGMQVRKLGAETSLTWGTITQFPVRARIEYKDKNRSLAGYSVSMECTPDFSPGPQGRLTMPFCEEGDSGSIVMTATDPPRGVALLVSSEKWRHKAVQGIQEDLLGRGIAIPLNRVLSRLKAELPLRG